MEEGEELLQRDLRDPDLVVGTFLPDQQIQVAFLPPPRRMALERTGFQPDKTAFSPLKMEPGEEMVVGIPVEEQSTPLPIQTAADLRANIAKRHPGRQRQNGNGIAQRAG